MAPKARAGGKRAARPAADEDLDELLAPAGGGGVSPLTFVFGLVLGVLAGGGSVLYAHARHADTPIDVAARTLLAAARDGCRLGELCAAGARRPDLEDGRPSHAVWDLPRYHMKSSFQAVRRVYPSVEVHYLWKDPVVVYFDGALADDEIKLMLDLATPRFTPSTVVQPDGTSKPDEGRTSDTAWLHFAHHDAAVEPIVNKLVSLAGFRGDNAESLGVNRYRESQYFRLHHDWMEEEGVLADPMFPKGCQRAATVLAYLSDTEEGGETVFVRDPDYDFASPITGDNPDMLVVKPRKGRVLVWFDMHPYRERVDLRTLHGGQPVVKGEKVRVVGSATARALCSSRPRSVPRQVPSRPDALVSAPPSPPSPLLTACGHHLHTQLLAPALRAAWASPATVARVFPPRKQLRVQRTGAWARGRRGKQGTAGAHPAPGPCSGRRGRARRPAGRNEPSGRTSSRPPSAARVDGHPPSPR